MRRLAVLAAMLAALTAPALADATSDVRTALAAFAHLSSFHLDITSSAGPSMAVDVVTPDKLHVTTGPVEAITIGGTTYLKVHGTWHHFSLPGMDRITDVTGGLQRLANDHDEVVVTDLGPKTVDGAPLHAYSVRSPRESHPAIVYLDANRTLVRLETSIRGGILAARVSQQNAPLAIAAPI